MMLHFVLTFNGSNVNIFKILVEDESTNSRPVPVRAEIFVGSARER